MALFNIGQSTGCAVNKYINSDFDKVANVSDNMEDVKNVSDHMGDVTAVSNKIADVSTVAKDIDKVVTVADNIDAVNSVNDNMNHVKDVSDNIAEVVQVSNGMENYQVYEDFTLTKGQNTVNLTKVMGEACKLEVMGQMVDGELLRLGVDYTVKGSLVTLIRSYPTGTILRATQAVYKTDDPIVVVDQLSAFNRRLVTIANNVPFEPYQEDGRTLLPRLLIQAESYVVIEDIEAGTVITSVDVTEEGNGVVLVQTNKGAKRFSRVLAEAVTRSDITIAAYNTISEAQAGDNTNISEIIINIERSGARFNRITAELASKYPPRTKFTDANGNIWGLHTTNLLELVHVTGEQNQGANITEAFNDAYQFSTFKNVFLNCYTGTYICDAIQHIRGTCKIYGNGIQLSPTNPAVRFLSASSSASMQSSDISGLELTGYDRHIDFQCDIPGNTYIYKNKLNSAKTTGIRLSGNSYGSVYIYKNEIRNVYNIDPSQTIQGIAVGKDENTAGVCFVSDNTIVNIGYTGASSSKGLDVHGIIILCAKAHIVDNIISNISSTMSEGATGCEAIYTKSFYSELSRNTLLNGGTSEAAIVVKGVDTSATMSRSKIVGNTITFDGTSSSKTGGIATFIDDVTIQDNVVVGVTRQAIRTVSRLSDDNAIDILSNTIINPASTAIQVNFGNCTVKGNLIKYPKYDATISSTYFGIVVDALEGTVVSDKKHSFLLSNNSLILGEECTVPTAFYYLKDSSTAKIHNITIAGDTVLEDGYTKRLFYIQAAAIHPTTILNFDNCGGLLEDQYNGSLAYNLHGNLPIWSAQPTVGTYKIGETGYYRYPGVTKFIGWVCITAGTVGSGAVFKNFGAVV